MNNPRYSFCVKRVVKPALIVVGILACLAGLMLLAINLYVQSPGTQMRLREAASESLGYPLSVFRISFVPFDGFHFQDVSIENPATGKPLLKARDLRIDCAYLPLFRKKLIIRESERSSKATTAAGGPFSFRGDQRLRRQGR